MTKINLYMNSNHVVGLLDTDNAKKFISDIGRLKFEKYSLESISKEFSFKPLEKIQDYSFDLTYLKSIFDITISYCRLVHGPGCCRCTLKFSLYNPDGLGKITLVHDDIKEELVFYIASYIL